jgi:hypothetical protein
MKKRTVKKIVLIKETLRSLTDADARNAVAGMSGAPYSCNASCLTEVNSRCMTTCDSNDC